MKLRIKYTRSYQNIIFEAAFYMFEGLREKISILQMTADLYGCKKDGMVMKILNKLARDLDGPVERCVHFVKEEKDGHQELY